MKLLGTVAHSRCPVMRLSSRMAPEPQSGSAMASAVLGWAQLRDRCALCTGRSYPPTPHCCCLCKMPLPSKHCFVSGLQGHRACEREEGPAREREGTGPSRLWAAQQLPSPEPLDAVCVTQVTHLCVSTPAWALWSLKGAKGTAHGFHF